ncbi:MAG: hypothetical protein ACI3Y5_01180 [Prevotella sp.]
MATSDIIDYHHPQPPHFGDTLCGNSESFFGDDIIILHTNDKMIRQTIGSGTPRRLHDMRIGLYINGEHESVVNLEHKLALKGTLEIYCPCTIYQMCRASDDLEMYELILSPDTLTELLSGNVPTLFQSAATSLSVQLSENEQRQYLDMMRLLLSLLRTVGERHPAVRGMAYTLMHYSAHLFGKHDERGARPQRRQEISSTSSHVC